MPDDTDRLTSPDGEPLDEQGFTASEPLEEQEELQLQLQFHRKRAVDKLLESFDEESRAVITMFYIEDLSVAEIAAELGKPPAYVKGKLRRRGPPTLRPSA